MEDCPNLSQARELLAEAVARAGGEVRVRERLVGDEAEAVRSGMRGSPTIRIAGVDLAPEEPGVGSLSCRLYRDGDRVVGAPSVEALVAALTVGGADAGSR